METDVGSRDQNIFDEAGSSKNITAKNAPANSAPAKPRKISGWLLHRFA